MIHSIFFHFFYSFVHWFWLIIQTILNSISKLWQNSLLFLPRRAIIELKSFTINTNQEIPHNEFSWNINTIEEKKKTSTATKSKWEKHRAKLGKTRSKLKYPEWILSEINYPTRELKKPTNPMYNNKPAHTKRCQFQKNKEIPLSKF